MLDGTGWWNPQRTYWPEIGPQALAAEARPIGAEAMLAHLKLLIAPLKQAGASRRHWSWPAYLEAVRR